MAGHSKWKQIKHKKAATDAKRAQVWTKAIREITVAARVAGGDPDGNPRLRTAIEAARAVNMPKDNIDRAIKRGAGELDGAEYVEIRYEGYGPGGTAVMVDCMTDNKNRSVAEVRHAFSKFGGNLGADGSVNYLFNHVGLLAYPAGSNEEAIMDAAIDAGAEDVVVDDDHSIEVLTDPTEYEAVLEKMRAAGYEPESCDLTMRATTSSTLALKAATSMIKMLEMLEDLDDVQSVYSNADISAEVLAQL